jgi:hypothetical protein
MNAAVLVDDAMPGVGGHACCPHMMSVPTAWNFKASIDYEWCQLHAGAINLRQFFGRLD